MGNFVVSALKVINCDTCAKYVCNACKVHSKCSGCCEVDVETTEIELPADSDSEMSVEVEGCCHFNKGRGEKPLH